MTKHPGRLVLPGFFVCLVLLEIQNKNIKAGIKSY